MTMRMITLNYTGLKFTLSRNKNQYICVDSTDLREMLEV